MSKPAEIYNVTKDLPHRIDDRVEFTFGTAKAQGKIVEYRGPLGVGRRRLWGIEFRVDDVSDSMYIELAEDEFNSLERKNFGNGKHPSKEHK